MIDQLTMGYHVVRKKPNDQKVRTWEDGIVVEAHEDNKHVKYIVFVNDHEVCGRIR